MSDLRRVAPLPLPGAAPADIGPCPEVRLVAPTSLWIDGKYQRDLSRASMSLLHKMVKEFAWNRMKVPNVTEVDGELHLIDGQHTAIVAATLRVPLIPVFVVEAADTAVRAMAFVGLNRDRVTVNPFHIHRALTAAGDEMAKNIEEACRRSGVRIRMAINQASAVAEGDTAALGYIRGMVKRLGVDMAADGLRILVKAKRAPITAPEIRAVQQVFMSYRDIDAEQLVRIIRADGDAGLISAHTQAKVTAVPVYQALVDRWKTKGMSGVRRHAAG
jgi:hypothetical protein